MEQINVNKKMKSYKNKVSYREEDISRRQSQLRKIQEERCQFIIENELYRSMSDLEEYRGETLEEILLVEVKEDGKCDICHLCDVEIEVTKDGYLYMESDTTEIEHVQNHTYNEIYMGLVTRREFVGFIDIHVDGREKEYL